MEKLSIVINNVIHQGNWDPICLTPNGSQLSHLLFVDDVLLFTKAKNSQLQFITDMFESFSQASSLKNNTAKSRAFSSTGTPREKINSLASIFAIRSADSLDKYLGSTVIKGKAKRSDFHFIIEKMQSRLAFWKHKLLNKPGRVTLALSVSLLHSFLLYAGYLAPSEHL
jgi:hypothetical protein